MEAPVFKNQWPGPGCAGCRQFSGLPVWWPRQVPALPVGVLLPSEPRCVKRFVPSHLAHNQTLPDPVRGPIQSLLLKVGVSSPCFSCTCLIPVWFPVLSTPGKPCDHQDKPVPQGLSLAPFICLIYFIEVELISSIVLISAIQQSDSIQCDSMKWYIYTHTYIYWVSRYGLAQRFRFFHTMLCKNPNEFLDQSNIFFSIVFSIMVYHRISSLVPCLLQ